MKKFIKSLFDNSHNILKIHNKSKKAYKYSKFLSERYINKNLKKYNCYIAPNAEISNNMLFPHPIGVVIGDGVKIGKNCTVFQNVTIGKKNDLYPTIGNNVTIYPGTVIVGNVKIGDNSIIGANSVVLHDVPPNTVVAGNPAKIIKKVNNDEK